MPHRNSRGEEFPLPGEIDDYYKGMSFVKRWIDELHTGGNISPLNVPILVESNIQFYQYYTSTDSTYDTLTTKSFLLTPMRVMAPAPYTGWKEARYWWWTAIDTEKRWVASSHVSLKKREPTSDVNKLLDEHERWQRGHVSGRIWTCGDDFCNCTQPIIERIEPNLTIGYPLVKRTWLWEGSFFSHADQYEFRQQLCELRWACIQQHVPVPDVVEKQLEAMFSSEYQEQM